MSSCFFKVKENLQTKSVFCGKLQQWVSSNYCNLCLDKKTDVDTQEGFAKNEKIERRSNVVNSTIDSLCLNNEAASSTKTTNENFSFYLYYVTSYLASYLHLEPKPKTQNTPKRLPTVSPSLKKFLLCGVPCE